MSDFSPDLVKYKVLGEEDGPAGDDGDDQVLLPLQLQDGEPGGGHPHHRPHHHVLLLPAQPCAAPHQHGLPRHGALDQIQILSQHHHHRSIQRKHYQASIIITGHYQASIIITGH